MVWTQRSVKEISWKMATSVYCILLYSGSLKNSNAGNLFFVCNKYDKSNDFLLTLIYILYWQIDYGDWAWWLRVLIVFYFHNCILLETVLLPVTVSNTG